MLTVGLQKSTTGVDNSDVTTIEGGSDMNNGKMDSVLVRRPGEAVLRAAEAERAAWVSRAVCRGVDPELLFVRGAAQREATAICRGCPVQMECLADALDHRVPFGVWGGLTERERRALLRDRPDVTSWMAHLRAVRAGEADGLPIRRPHRTPSVRLDAARAS